MLSLLAPIGVPEPGRSARVTHMAGEEPSGMRALNMRPKRHGWQTTNRLVNVLTPGHRARFETRGWPFTRTQREQQPLSSTGGPR